MCGHGEIVRIGFEDVRGKLDYIDLDLAGVGDAIDFEALLDARIHIVVPGGAAVHQQVVEAESGHVLRRKK